MNIDIKTLIPNASESTKRANPHLYGDIGNDLALGRGSTSKNAVQPIVATRRGKMNKVESEYAMILEAMKRRGEILRYEFEGMTLRWFDMRYTPDFVVFRDVNLYPVGTDWMYFVEVKGAHVHYAQQAMARFKGARGFWPEFTFELHQKTKNGWKQLI